jgi:hypothetical protein
MTFRTDAGFSRIPALNQRAFVHALISYVVIPVALGWFGYVSLAGASSLSPRPVRLPSTTVYDPYLDDFTVFYTAGKLTREGSADDVYRVEQLHLAEAEVLRAPPSKVLTLPFFNPPFSLGVFAALSLLSLPVAAAVWTVAGLGSCAATAAALWADRRRAAPATLLALALGAVSSPPFFQTLLHGQTTFFLLLGFVLLWLGLGFGRRAETLLTCALVLIAHKPQLIVLPAAYLLAVGLWRPVLKAGLVLAAITAIIATLTGWGVVIDHVRLLLSATRWHDSNGISTWGMFGWNAFAEALGIARPQTSVLVAALDLATLGIVGLGLRRTSRLGRDRLLAVLIFGALLVSPHVYEHDVLLAALPVFLMATAGDRVDRVVWAVFGALGWATLYFHFDLLNATSINFTALWLAGGLLLGAFPPHKWLGRRARWIPSVANLLIQDGAGS